MKRVNGSRRSLGVSLGLLLPLLLALVAIYNGMVAERPVVPTMRDAITVGAAPRALTLDERRGRAFIVNGGDATVSVLDLRQGKVIRTIRIGAHPLLMAEDHGSGYVIVVDNGDPNTFVRTSARVLDGVTGLIIRTTPVGVWPRDLALATPLHRAFIANFGSGSVVALDMVSGQVAWTSDVHAGAASVAVDARAQRVLVVARVITHGHLGPLSRAITLDATSGKVLHALSLPMVDVPIAVDEATGHAFIAIARGSGRGVAMLDDATGRLLKAIAVPAQGVNLLVMNTITGRLFVFGSTRQGGILAIIDARHGRLLRSTITGPWLGVATVNARTGHVVAVHDDATPSTPDASLDVLDGRTGVPMRTLSAGVDPVAVAADGATGQVVLANGRATAPTPRSWLTRVLPGFATGQRQPYRPSHGIVSIVAEDR